MTAKPGHWPDELRLKDNGRLLGVKFEDGAEFALSAEYLRVMSPSAEVQGHRAQDRVTVGGKRRCAIIGIEPVGTYAVRLSFDDMHSTGIFTWDYLYELGARHAEKWAAYEAELQAPKGSTATGRARPDGNWALGRPLALLDDDARADLDAVVKIDDVVIGHPDASRRDRLTDRIRLVRAMDAVERAAEIHGARAERILGAAVEEPRQIGAPAQHLGRRLP